MKSTKQYDLFLRKSFFNLPERKLDNNICADKKVKSGLDKIDRKSNDVKELLTKLETMISDFGSQNNLNTKSK